MHEENDCEKFFQKATIEHDIVIQLLNDVIWFHQTEIDLTIAYFVEVSLNLIVSEILLYGNHTLYFFYIKPCTFISVFIEVESSSCLMQLWTKEEESLRNEITISMNRKLTLICCRSLEKDGRWNKADFFNE